MTTELHKKITHFQLLMLALSVYVLVALFVETVFTLSRQATSLLRILDTLICFVFLGDFFYRLYRAEHKAAFMRWGWIDLVSSIPMMDLFRWGRIVRVVRILRILRGVRSVKVILGLVLQAGVRGTLSLVFLVSAVFIVFSAIAILNAEKSPDSNIKDVGDALWWAVVTITTVGYGDKYPVTGEGRIVAAFLMVAGVGLFGTFTACISSLLLKAGAKEESPDTDLVKEVRLLREHLGRLEEKLTGARPSLPAQFGPTQDGI
ncbi:MAG TPA: ion transporter [Candidatus Dormibacteraeota bacterium]|nr:ion transporter [Candidatus Dormibacteraeota bacterium]